MVHADSPDHLARATLDRNTSRERIEHLNRFVLAQENYSAENT
jgi:hypothetical protein